MNKDKSVQIPFKLFLNCLRLICFEEDNTKLREETKTLIWAKFEQIQRRELFTAYKTAATDEEREQARRNYLDRVGIPEDFRSECEFRLSQIDISP